MRKIAGTLLAETQFNFLDEGRPGGCPRWQRKNVTGDTAGYRASDGVSINRPALTTGGLL